jgi:hypothetical protein
MSESALSTLSKQQQQLIHCYQQRQQLNAQQKILAEASPTAYQTIYLNDPVVSSEINHQQLPRQATHQAVDQQLQSLNTLIQSQEDKLTGLEKEAMQWLQGTGQNEKREIKRTQDGITAESTLKHNSDTDMASTLLLGIAALGLAAFVLNELLSFIKANPEAISMMVLVMVALFFIIKKNR